MCFYCICMELKSARHCLFFLIYLFIPWCLIERDGRLSCSYGVFKKKKKNNNCCVVLLLFLPGQHFGRLLFF